MSPVIETGMSAKSMMLRRMARCAGAGFTLDVARIRSNKDGRLFAPLAQGEYVVLFRTPAGKGSRGPS
jgi:hypothetical protein